MIQALERFEREAERAGQRHLVLIQGFFGVKQRMMSSPYALTPRAIRDLKIELEALAWSHIESERTIAADILDEIARDARRDAVAHLGLSVSQNDEDAPSDALNASQTMSEEYLSGEVLNQIGRDVNQVLRDYRSAALRAEILKSTRGLSHGQAVIQIAIDDMSDRQRVWFRDRAGRRIPSQKYIRRLMRQVLRDHYVAVYMQTLAEYGETEAVVWHPDPRHGFFGETLVIGAQNYGLDDPETIFHPSSNALPVARAFMSESVA